MTRIFKYALGSRADSYRVSIAKHAKIIHIGGQNDVVCFWAEVDSGQPSVIRHFLLLHTGDKIPDGLSLTFLGTVLLRPDYTVHAYEIHSK